jgi:hypothetical protein
MNVAVVTFYRGPTISKLNDSAAARILAVELTFITSPIPAVL